MVICTWGFDDVAVLDLHGRLGVGADLALQAAVSDVLRAGRHHIVINLTGVSTLDASGLGDLVQALKQTRARGGDVRLVVRSGLVRALLERTRLLGVFPTFDTESQALASVDGVAPLVQHRVRPTVPGRVVAATPLFPWPVLMGSLESAQLALSASVRLGPYEILSALGAGGVGEVQEHYGMDAIKVGDPQLR